MSENEFLDALGAYYGEPAVDGLLKALGVCAKPEADKGSDTAYIVDEARGVELAFTDEVSLDPPATREYPEGALVLSSIRLFHPTDSDADTAPQLPFGLQLGMQISGVISLLGLDHDAFPEDNLYRWEKTGYCLFCEFQEDALTELCMTLPIPDDMK